MNSPAESRSFPLRRWVITVGLAEAIGFVVPGGAWFFAWWVELPPALTFLIVVIGGAGEGAVLGAGQWLVLRRYWPGFSPRWIWATAGGAAIAWACGMTPSTAFDFGLPTPGVVALAILLGPVLLFAMPLAQVQLLRPWVTRPRRWLPLSTLAWVLALPPTFIFPALLPSEASTPLIAVTWFAAGVCMAVIVASVLGLSLRRMARTNDDRVRTQRRIDLSMHQPRT